MQVKRCNAASRRTSEEREKARYGKICGRNYPSLDSRGFSILNVIRSHTSMASLELNSSPQHKSMCWIIHDDSYRISASSGKMIERYSLASLWFATAPENWLMSENWLQNVGVCYWYGVTCDKWGYVVDLDLGFNGLLGLVPKEISLMKYLEGLRLTANDLQGVIPTSIGNLSNLQVLQLNMNGFFGMIPSTMGELASLRELHLYGNYFDGTLPTEIGQMKNLEILDLYANYLKGKIPKEISELKYLKGIFLNDNELGGKVPKQVCDMKTLEFFATDCLGPRPEIICPCCTHCCKETQCQKMDEVIS